MTLEDMAALHAACFPDAPWNEETIRTLVDQPMTRLVTTQGGFLIASIIPPEAEILTLCVDPDQRRKGKAALMLGQLAQEAEVIFLEVAADNSPALVLYAAHGFRETGRRKAYYTRPDGTKTDAITMSCRVSGG
jgi:ribosomal-protein-alanine N-acetyltransferase